MFFVFMLMGKRKFLVLAAEYKVGYFICKKDYNYRKKHSFLFFTLNKFISLREISALSTYKTNKNNNSGRYTAESYIKKIST